MKKKIILSFTLLIMLSFWIYQKFYICTTDSRASTDHLARICTDATVAYWKEYDVIVAKRDTELKAVKEKANLARKIRDERVERVNEQIRKDIVFRKVEK